jgi:hypothetical protein
VVEEALTRRDVRAAREMKKVALANPAIRLASLRLRDPFDDCAGVTLDAVPAPEPVLGPWSFGTAPKAPP